MKCPQCDHEVEQGAAFCGSCGLSLAQPQAAAQPPMVQAAATPVPPAPVAPAAPIQQAAAPVAPGAVPVQTPMAQVVANQNWQQPPQPVQPGYGMPAGGGAAPAMPAYAVPVAHHPHDTQAVLSLVFAVLALLACLFVAFLGIILAVVSIVLATMSRKSPKRVLGTIGIVISAVTLLLSFGAIAYYATQELSKSTGTPVSSPVANTVSAVSSSDTPCYSVDFAQLGSFKAEQKPNSCSVVAYNGTNPSTSNLQYVITSTFVAGATPASLERDAKMVLRASAEKYFSDFTINSEGKGTFAGGAAYSLHSSRGGSAIIQTAVLKPTTGGDNVFVIMHSGPGDTVDLKALEAGWRWK